MQIGELRRKLFRPYPCPWNGFVLDITTEYEGKDGEVSETKVMHAIADKCAQLINLKENVRC